MVTNLTFTYMDYRVPQDENLGGVKARELFITGRCALTIDWGDIGPLAIDLSVSEVMDKVGAVITPGTTQVLDRKTRRLVACDMSPEAANNYLGAIGVSP